MAFNHITQSGATVHAFETGCSCYFRAVAVMGRSTVRSKILRMLHLAVSAAAVQHNIRSAQADPVTVHCIDHTD